MIDNVEIPTQEYKIEGVLRRLEDRSREVQPQPPTPITQEARERLTDWGISENQIEDLRKMTSAFRYDLCPEKLERICKIGGYFDRGRYGDKVVILPHMNDFKVRTSGQCGEIAVRLLNDLNFTGYIDRLNEDLTEKEELPIYPCLVSGKSRTHFIGDKSNHVWLGLMQAGMEASDMVIVDGSFQEISNLDQSKYQVANLTENPRKIENYYLSRLLHLGKYHKSRKGVEEIEIGTTAILGSSADRKVCYGLGFVDGITKGKISPYIYIYSADAQSDSVAIATDKEPKWFEYHAVEPHHREEVIKMLNIIRNIKLENNPQKAAMMVSATQTIKYE